MLANLSPASSASLKLGARAEITITQATLAGHQNRVVLAHAGGRSVPRRSTRSTEPDRCRRAKGFWIASLSRARLHLYSAPGVSSSLLFVGQPTSDGGAKRCARTT